MAAQVLLALQDGRLLCRWILLPIPSHIFLTISR